MKCICRKPCFIKNPEGRNERFRVGQVRDFDKCPTHFTPIEGVSVDFLTASKEELTNTKWKLEDAKKAVKDAFGVTLTGKKKETLVNQILDARDRNVPEEEITQAK